MPLITKVLKPERLTPETVAEILWNSEMSVSSNPATGPYATLSPPLQRLKIDQAQSVLQQLVNRGILGY